MKILAVCETYVPGTMAGSEISAHYLIRYLKGRGHDVQVYMPGHTSTYEHDGISVVGLGNVDEPDVVFTQLWDGVDWAQEYARLHDKPLVYWAHTVRAHAVGDLWIANSHSLLADYGRFLNGAETIVLHEPVDPMDHVTSRDSALAVTRVGLSSEKGVEVFQYLYASMKDTAFLGVQNAWGVQRLGPDTPVPSNTTIWPHQSEMRRVWALTRVLIMPSDGHETYGRVGVEAMASGIPIVATPEPGIKEAMGDAAIYVVRQDYRGWREALLRLRDPVEYAEWSRRASQRCDYLWQRTESELVETAVAIERLV